MSKSTKTIIVAGQEKVCCLARTLIEHRTPFSIKPIPERPTEIFIFEMTIPACLAAGTYEFALADDQGDLRQGCDIEP